MKIRPEQAADVPTIRALITEAFATVQHSDQREAEITEALRAAGALSCSLVAEREGLIVGHVAFSPVALQRGEQVERGYFGLGPLSVRPSEQRRGVGAALVRAGMSELSARGAKGCVVLGEPEYYRRFGFTQREGLVLDGVPPEYFLGCAFAGPPPRGRVEYHAAFSV